MKPSARFTTHEDLTRREELRVPSNRAFGVVFTTVFLVVGLLPLWTSRPVRVWAVVLAGVFLAITLTAPGLLTGPNRLWMRLGLCLHRLFSPVLLGCIFFGVFTPMAWLLRLRKKDLLCLRFDPAAETYWITRHPPGPDPKSMAHQF